jgi:hypothetical protein
VSSEISHFLWYITCSGLDTLLQLRELHLDANEISEIEHLDHLADLEVLVLNDNHISEISGTCVYIYMCVCLCVCVERVCVT